MEQAEQKIRRLIHTTPNYHPAYQVLNHAHQHINNPTERTKDQLKQQLHFSLMIYEEIIPVEIVEIVSVFIQ